MTARLGNRIFDFFVYLIIIVAVLVCLLPFMHIISLSLSSNEAIIGRKVFILPVEFTLDSYRMVFHDNSMMRSLGVTIQLTVMFTVISMIMTICAAYPLTKKRLKGRTFLLFMIVVTMYFSGGLIPDYLLIKELKLLNSIWSLILPGMISVFNLIVLKTFFSESIPDSIEESAFIDGCSDIGILLRIVLPLSLPVLATLSLFSAVFRWNGFIDAMFYISDPNLFPLPMKLYQIIYNNMVSESSIQDSNVLQNLTTESMKAASIMFATVPILVIYPWLQKYFVNGITLGAVKG